MSDTTEFMYRLPLSYVRVVGSRRESHDTVADVREEQHEAVVTTEFGADLHTRCSLTLAVDEKATGTSTWKLTPDGRLTGADLETTVDRYARWAPFVKLGLAGATLAMPFLLPGAGGALAAAGLAVGAARTLALAKSIDGETLAEGHGHEPTPDVRRLQRYRQERSHDHQVLVGLRQALQEQESAFVEAASGGGGGGLAWRQRALVVVRTELDRAETRYAAWLDGYVERTTCPYDERVPIYRLPATTMLQQWAEGGDPSAQPETTDWELVEQMVAGVRTAVSVDVLDPHQRRAQVADAGEDFAPEASSGSVWWRRPRLAVVATWKVRQAEDGSASRWAIELVETQRMLVAYPGNEGKLFLRPTDEESSSVAAIFHESGALTELTSARTGSAVQRSADVSSLLAGAKEAVAAGAEARDALSPPSLKEQAEAAEAWAKLHPTAPDADVARMEKRIAEEERSARLRLAQQLGTASSPPVIVRVDQT